MALEITSAFLDRQLAKWHCKKPLVLGVSGPQGSGKSYLAEHLLHHLQKKHQKWNCIVVLIDDFYLTHAEQVEVSTTAKKSGNFLLEGRGLPGTHDLQLAVSTMHKLVTRERPVHVPRYDKSAFSGKGDRFPVSKWQIVDLPVDVIVFEGWFCGYESIDSTVFPSVYLSSDPSGIVQRSSMHHLEAINEKLIHYEELWEFFDYSVALCTKHLGYVYKWRLQQEADLIAHTGQGMSEPAVVAFVRRYMPMYELYYWRLCEKKGISLRLQIDFDRNVTGTL